MACFKPISGYRCRDGTVRFYDKNDGDPIEVPCGQCVGCRLERSRQWAVRCMHEAQMHKEKTFVTFTYDDDYLPIGGSLRYRDYQLFMMRLIKKFGPVRFYMCGEYGAQTFRPHYHSILFGVDFSDKVRYRKGSDGTWLYDSAVLKKLWPWGDTCFGDVTFQSAAYVSRYCMAKVTGSAAAEHYKSVDLYTGEALDRVPEFNRMSLKPGIGAEWFEKFKKDVYPRNYVVINGVKCKPPKYYDKLFDKLDSATMDVLKFDRSLDIRHEDCTIERLKVREICAEARANLLLRPVE